MAKEDSERRIADLLPDASNQVMKDWLEYAKNLDRDGAETEPEIFNRSFVEFTLIKRRQSMETIAALLSYGEKLVFNYFKLRGTAELLKKGWLLEQVDNHAVENGCDPTLETIEKSHAALEESRSGKWDTRENKRKSSSDLSQGIHQFYALKQGSRGQSRTFSEWIRVAYEINEDFDQLFAEVVSGLCGALHDADAQYGHDISRQLYNTFAVALSTKIQSAAQYLNLGGSLDYVLALALVGFLMEPQNHDSMLRAVEHMNDGGDVASAYYAAEGEVFEDHSPQRQQIM